MENEVITQEVLEGEAVAVTEEIRANGELRGETEGHQVAI